MYSRKRRSRKEAPRSPEKHGGVAQLGEHLPCTQGVKGSNPFISTTDRKVEGQADLKITNRTEYGLIAQAVRARA